MLVRGRLTGKVRQVGESYLFSLLSLLIRDESRAAGIFKRISDIFQEGKWEINLMKPFLILDLFHFVFISRFKGKSKPELQFYCGVPNREGRVLVSCSLP